MIKGHEDCAARRFVTYQADAHFLPSTFDDGSVHFGPDRSVILEEITPNRHIEIYLRYIDTTVVVRHYHKFLTVSLLMPEKILNQSTSHLADGDVAIRTLELCSRGCPDNQRIDYMAYLASAHSVRLRPPESQRLFATEKNSVAGMEVVMTRQQALEWCQQLRLVDFYLDSCVFDLLNTGDTNFSEASVDAQADTVRLHPDGAGTLQNRTELGDLPDIRSSAVSVLHVRTFQCHAVLAALVACALAQCLSGVVSILAASKHTVSQHHQHPHPQQQQQHHQMQRYHHHCYSHQHQQPMHRINSAVL